MHRTVLPLAFVLLVSACGPGPATDQAAVAATPAKVCDPAAAGDCAAGEFCRTETGSEPGKKGVCTPKGNMCNMLYQPVCGKDGKTYPNACHAARAGMNLAYGGLCKPQKAP